VLPLSSVGYVTASNFAGDQLVVGSLPKGLSTHPSNIEAEFDPISVCALAFICARFRDRSGSIFSARVLFAQLLQLPRFSRGHAVPRLARYKLCSLNNPNSPSHVLMLINSIPAWGVLITAFSGSSFWYRLSVLFGWCRATQRCT